MTAHNKILTGLFLIALSVGAIAQQPWGVSEQYTNDGGVVVMIYNNTPYQIYCQIESQRGRFVDFFVYPHGMSQPYKFFSRYRWACET